VRCSVKKTILVGYITRAGYTRTVARAIDRRLRELGFQTDVADLELCIRHPPAYDAVVLGSAVRFGHHPTAMQQFIAENHAALCDRPTAFFSVERHPAGDATEKLFRLTNWRASCVLTLPGVRGALLRRTIAWVEDRLEKSATPPTAPTDWARIDRFANDIAALVSDVTRPRASPVLAHSAQVP
jgi:menaquinone-dependent protoporphyrinogen oxidase